MKLCRTFLFFAAFFLAFISTGVSWEAPKELAGDDWIRMLHDEQLEFVSVALKAYEDQGIKIQRPPQFYVYSLSTAVLGNSLNDSENLTELLRKILVKNEPALRNLVGSQDPKIQNIEMH